MLTLDRGSKHHRVLTDLTQTDSTTVPTLVTGRIVRLTTLEGWVTSFHFGLLFTRKAPNRCRQPLLALVILARVDPCGKKARIGAVNKTRLS